MPELLNTIKAIQDKYITEEQIVTMASDQKASITTVQQQNKSPIHQHFASEQQSPSTPRLQDTIFVSINQIEPVSSGRQ